ncbi:MAG: ABC transporter substrate-binding protein [Deltaproteobacteria bacterium]|jgi:peptide/nickel transport system substrate-binding protein|nr:ABC transporter substrate-binding protein [Deltaproteobacteria bacterium]
MELKVQKFLVLLRFFKNSLNIFVFCKFLFGKTACFFARTASVFVKTAFSSGVLASFFFCLAWGTGVLWADTLKIIYQNAPKTLDPHAGDPHSYPIIMNSYRRLFDLQDGENILTTTSSLARTARVSDDGLIYTIILREGESFADGSRVNPEAILFSFDRLMASDAGKSLFPYLKFLRIDGPNTLALILERPWPPFLASLALPEASIISPILAGYPADYLKTHSLGSGRYVVDSYVDNKIVLSQRGDIPQSNSPETVEIYYESDPQAILGLYRKMEAHLAILSPPILEEVPPGSELRFIPTWTTRYLAFNFETEYFQKREIREALAAVAENVFSLKDIRPQGMLPRGFAGAPAAAPQLNLVTAPERARALIAAAGFPQTPLRLVFYPNEKNALEDARLLAENFNSLGLKVNIIPLQGSEGKGILEKNDYDLYLGTRHPEIPSGEMWLGKFLDSRAKTLSNPAHFKDPVVDSQIDNFDASLTRPEREGRIKGVATLAARERPYVLLYQDTQTFVADKRLASVVPHPMWPLFWPLDKINLNPFRAGVEPFQAPPGSPPVNPQLPEPTRDFDETVFEPYE